jgi:hypothetical protein
MVGYFSVKGGPDVFYFQDVHQVLRKFINPGSQLLGPAEPTRLIRQKFWVVVFHRAHTRARRTDDNFILSKDGDKMLGHFSGLFLVAGIYGRLATAGLLFVIDRVNPYPAEQGYGRLTNAGQEKIHRARDE